MARRGLDPRELIVDTSRSLEFLRSRRNRVHWDEFRSVLDRLVDHYDDTEIVDIGRHLVHTEAQRPFGLIAKRFFSVSDFYRAVFSSASGWGQPMFPCMESTFVHLDDGVFEATLALRPGFAPCEPFMLITQGNITGMPEVLGSPPADVRMESIERGARFLIRATETAPRLARLRRRVTLPFRAEEMAAELREAHASLRSRHDALEDALAERERTADALRESETRLRLMLESVEMSVWDWDMRSDILVMDDVGQKMLGFDESEVSPAFASFLERVAEEDRDVVAGAVQAVLETGGSYAQQFRISRDGEVRTLTSRGHVFRGESGEPVRFIGVAHDVTDELRRTERQAHLGRVVASSPLEIYVVDPATLRILDANVVACRNLGYTEDEVVQLEVADIIGSDGATGAAFSAIVNGERDRTFGLVRNRRKDGSTYSIELTVQTSVLDSQPVLIAIGLDVSGRVRAEQERRDLESQLWRTQKLEALGTLASGITHDFNNLLMAISTFTELAQRELPADSRSMRHLDRVLRAADQGKALASQILTFSRSGDQLRAPAELGPVVLEAIELLRAALPATVRVEIDVAESGCVVDVDAGQIGQVVTNLCTNAAQATEATTGTVEVRLEARELGPADVEPFPALRPGPHAVLTVTDDGEGIAADVLEQIFDPFFTTRDLEGGTGLGLAVVHGIVRAHEGAIDVESEPGRGTTMSVLLPCVVPGGAPADVAASAVTAHSGRVLLVDDNVAVADALAIGLEALGYAVSTFSSSTRALEMFRADPGSFDIVLTDQTMPDLTGLQLAERLRGIRADIPIVLISGLGAPVDDTDAPPGVGISEVLAKPFGLDELGNVIARVLSTDRDR